MGIVAVIVLFGMAYLNSSSSTYCPWFVQAKFKHQINKQRGNKWATTYDSKSTRIRASLGELVFWIGWWGRNRWDRRLRTSSLPTGCTRSIGIWDIGHAALCLRFEDKLNPIRWKVKQERRLPKSWMAPPTQPQTAVTLKLRNKVGFFLFSMKCLFLTRTSNWFILNGISNEKRTRDVDNLNTMSWYLDSSLRLVVFAFVSPFISSDRSK